MLEFHAVVEAEIEFDWEEMDLNLIPNELEEFESILKLTHFTSCGSPNFKTSTVTIINDFLNEENEVAEEFEEGEII